MVCEGFERVLDSESSIRALSIENAKAFWEAFGLTRGKQLADLVGDSPKFVRVTRNIHGGAWR